MFVPLRGPAQQISLELDRWNRAAIEWIHLLRDGDFERAGAQVDPAVPAGALDASALSRIWTQVTAQLGALESVEPGRVMEQGGYHIADLAGTFERQSLTVRVVFTDALEVSGLFFRPAAPPPYEAPEYVDATAFREEEVTVGAAPWELPGTLAIPEREGPFPLLVLVHGSGPNDRDETLAGNRPFRDLAWGLASAGVAVLRYDKRTFTHGSAMQEGVGLDGEVIEDALAALRLARDHPDSDPERIFLAGHSLGGMLAPAIAERAGSNLAGVAILAGPARSFAAVLREQITYAISLRGEIPPETRAAVDSILNLIDLYEAGILPEDREILGAPPAYLRELDAVRPLETARNLELPILVLQGGRDYQVTMEDFRLWEEALADRENVLLRAFPGLNHLFAPGEGMATPEEYASQVKHVAREVVELLASWIRGGGS